MGTNKLLMVNTETFLCWEQEGKIHATRTAEGRQ